MDSSGHPYITRVLTRYPRQQRRFSGRVLIEPFNTTYGIDRDALWLHTRQHVAVPRGRVDRDQCARVVAVELKRHDPQRYRDVDVPSNDLAWSVLQAIGTLIKLGGEHSPLGTFRSVTSILADTPKVVSTQLLSLQRLAP